MSLEELAGYLFNDLELPELEKKNFISYVVESPADWTRIRVFKNKMNEWVELERNHKIIKFTNSIISLYRRAEIKIRKLFI